VSQLRGAQRVLTRLNGPGAEWTSDHASSALFSNCCVKRVGPQADPTIQVGHRWTAPFPGLVKKFIARWYN
jgi:hypothetical protein